MANIFEIVDGFDTPKPDWDIDFDGGIIHPKLCDKIEEIEDCPYNTARRACIDCDVIIIPDRIFDAQEHVDFKFEEE